MFVSQKVKPLVCLYVATGVGIELSQTLVWTAKKDLLNSKHISMKLICFDITRGELKDCDPSESAGCFIVEGENITSS